MKKRLIIFLGLLFSLILIDQCIKWFMIIKVQPHGIDGFHMIWDFPVISIALVFNTGVAFSFLTELGEYLKFIQIGLIAFLIVVLCLQRQLFQDHYIPFGMMFGGGISNVLDRFLHGGVVDYIYWHYKFDFPIFNFADIIIDCGIALFLWQILFCKKSRTNFA